MHAVVQDACPYMAFPEYTKELEKDSEEKVSEGY